jgi:GAF domain-containing protein
VNNPSTKPAAAECDYERQLRDMNEALIVSSVRQHELTEQAQKAETDLRASEERLAEELTATQRLQETSTQLIREENVQALYEQILNAAVAIMRSDYASIQMLYPERGPGGELRLLGHRGFNPEAVRFWEWVRPPSQSTCGIALRTGQRVIVADVQKCDFMAGSGDLETYLQTGIHAVQTTPLLSRGGQLLGMISTHWHQPHEPSERDLRLLDVLARQAADLIERSQAEESLREADRRKDEFLAMLGHELRNPLGIISTSAQILRRLAPSDAKTEELRDTIERQVIHTSQMLDDLLDISRISRGKIQLKKQRWDFRASFGR